jgi:UDP-GlcNAc:undecaprenyl-phosphate/decaprenyl-phosphate GlcNAc-1-phosphate transferase
MHFLPSSLAIGVAAFALGTALTSALLYLASRVPWLARSSSNRLHVAPTPVFGGIAIFVSFMAVALVRGLFTSRELIPIVISTFGIFLLGLADDIWKLRPAAKLLGQTLCAVVPVLFVVRHPLTGNKFIDIVVALLWMVGITNAFNLLDNINGLSAGTAVLVSAFQAVVLFNQNEPGLALANVALGGAIVGFLTFNFPNGRIFMGDSGSLFIGFWLAATALTGTQFSGKNHFAAFLFPLLVMVVPICDTTLVTMTRILRGRPVSEGGTDHLSHRLMAYGFTQKSTVIALWVLTLLSGALGYFEVSYGLSPFLSLVLFLIVAVSLFGTYLTRHDLQSLSSAPLAAKSRSKIAGWVRVSARVLLDLVLIVTAYYTAYLLRFDRQMNPADMHLLASTIAEIALIKLGVFVAFGAYRPWWDYFGLRDAYRLVGTSALASLSAVAYFAAVYRFYGFSRIVIVLDFLAFTLLALVFRFSFRLLDEIAPANHRTNVFIYGANTEGETALQFVSKHYRYRVVGFLDDDRGKRDFSIHSVPIRGGTQDVSHLCRQWQARAILVTPSTPEEVRERLKVLGDACGIKLLCLHLTIEELFVPEPPASEPLPSGRAATEVPQASAKAFSNAGSD